MPRRSLGQHPRHKNPNAVQDAPQFTPTSHSQSASDDSQIRSTVVTPALLNNRSTVAEPPGA